MQRDRDGLNSNVLRFVAKLDTTRPIDMDRRFIVFYHLSDDTIAVFEPPQRNSGITKCQKYDIICVKNTLCIFSSFRYYWWAIPRAWSHFQA